MPDRRMIHRKAAVSSDLADLRDSQGPDAALFYVLLIPFYDRYGCVPDDPRALRGMICSMWDDVTVNDVKGWVAWLVKRGMLVRVKGPSGQRGLRSPRFEEHQAGAKLEREAPSLYEPPTVSKTLRRTRPPKVTGDSHDDVTPAPKRARKTTTRKTGATSKAAPKTPPDAGRSGLGPDPVRTRSGKRSKEVRGSPTGNPPSPMSPSTPNGGAPSSSQATPSPSSNGRSHDVTDPLTAERIDAVLPEPVRRQRKAERSGGAT